MVVLGRKKACPDCAERVAAQAKVCRFCGYRFPDEPEESGKALAADGRGKARKVKPAQAPHEPPQPDDVGTETEGEIAKYGPPKSIRGWAIAACVGLAAIGLAIAWNILADLDQLDLADRFQTSGGSEVDRVAYNDGIDKIDTAGLAYLGAYVVGGILFIGFFHAAYTNVARLGGRGLRFKFGQAIWPWFVPIINLIRPKEVANDIWRGSHSLDRSEPRSWREAS